MLLEIK